MKYRGLLVRAAAVVVLGGASLATAKPVEASVTRACGITYCSNSCESNPCGGGCFRYCQAGACDGVDGNVYYAAITCGAPY